MKNHLKETYGGKKVFVTGHTGFKGAWLITLLQWLGADVKGYALAPENDCDLYYKIDGDRICNSVIADLRDRNRLEKEMLDYQPDFIFHLAAQPLVRKSYELPAETFEINVSGTAFFLDAVRKLRCKCSIVLITTDKVYENREWDYPYRETDRLGGHDPYSASKAACEIVISSFRHSYFNKGLNSPIAIASARAGNVIGGGDWAKDRIIPDIVRALAADQSVWVRNPHSVRPWQHVLEPLSGYLLLGALLDKDPEKYGSAWNFGPQISDNLIVKDIVEMAIGIWGKGSYHTASDDHSVHEACLLRLDISHTVNELGWRPRWTAIEAIQHTIEWYKQASGAEKEYMIKQIELYHGF